MKPGGGNIDGKLAIDPLPQQGSVIAVPTSSSSTGPVVAVIGAGEFGIESLAPGDYILYAFSKFEAVEFRNPGVLQALNGGTSVHVEDGKTTEVALKAVVK